MKTMMDDLEASNGSTSSTSDADSLPSLGKIPLSNSPHGIVSADPSSVSGSSEAKQQQEKICVVCGDTATGTHFAAMTCEGCKGFFRRSMKKCSRFTCAFENQCSINKSNRKHCQACRLRKCMAVGMNSNLIMSDESVERKRELIRANRERKALLKVKKEQEEMEQCAAKKLEASPKPDVQMMAEDKALIKMMLDSHNASYDFSYEEYETFRGTQHIEQPNAEDIKKSHVTLAWLRAGKEENTSSGRSPSSDQSTKKKPAEKVGEEHIVGVKKVKAEPRNLQSFGAQRYPPGVNPGDFLEMFGSLHGVSQQRFGVPPPSTPPSSRRHDSSYYSDGSGSSSSTSPHPPPKNPNFELDAFTSGFPSSFLPDQAAGGMMPVFGDSPGMLTDEMDSMSMLQGLFMSQDMSDGKPHSLFQHFCDIMTWGIKKVIEFCKYIPEFQELSTVDQINLLRGGCLEMLVLRSYFAFASDGVKYMSDKFEYSPTDFLTAGVNSEFVEQYTKIHMRMRRMKLKVEEICLLIGLVLFSPDRPGVENCEKVEMMQKRIAQALRAYEYTNHEPEKACVAYSELLLLLPVLRTINVLFSNSILTLKSGKGDDMDPLILEVNN